MTSGNRSAETRRRQSVRLRYEFEIEVSLEEWADWAGIDPARAEFDIDQYVTSSIPDLPGLAETGSAVRWRDKKEIRMPAAEATLLRKRWTGGNVSRPAIELDALPFGADDDDQWG